MRATQVKPWRSVLGTGFVTNREYTVVKTSTDLFFLLFFSFFFFFFFLFFVSLSRLCALQNKLIGILKRGMALTF